MSIIDDFNPMKVLVHKEKIEDLINFHTGLSNVIPYPVMLEIDPSNVCNYRCSFCQCGDALEKKHSTNLLQEKDWFDNILPFIVEAKVEGVFFCGGGEPTINLNLYKYIESLNDLNVNSCMTSNGSLVTDILARACRKNCKWITFSVNAGDEETFIRTNNSKNITWEGYCENLKRFVGIVKHDKNEISYKFVYTPENYHAIYCACNIAIDMGFDQFIVKPADLTWSREGYSKKWEESDLNNVRTMITETTETFGNDIKIKSLEYYHEEDTKMVRDYKTCWTQSLAPVLHPDGNMSICCDLREVYNIGKWNDPTLLEFWGSYKHIQAVRKFNRTGLRGCPIRCKMGRYNSVVQKIMLDGEINTCFL